MKKFFYTLLAMCSLSSMAMADDILLTVASSASGISATLPAGQYVVNGAEVVSSGEAMQLSAQNGLIAIEAASGKVKSLLAPGQPITAVDLSMATELAMLDLSNCQIETCKSQTAVSALQEVYMSGNKLSSNPFSGTKFSTLRILDLSDNRMTTCTSTGLSNLEVLIISNNQISALTCSNMPNLVTLWCDNNAIKSLNPSSCTKLCCLVADNNQLTTLTSTGLANLTDLWVSGNKLSKINTTSSGALLTLNASDNALTEMKLRKLDAPALFVDVDGNNLTFSNLYDLTDVDSYLFENQTLKTMNKSGKEHAHVAHNEEIYLPAVADENNSGTSLTGKVSTLWYNCADDSKLKQGSTKNTTGDYAAVEGNHIYYFKANFTGECYAEQTCSLYPGVTLRSNTVYVSDADGVNSLIANGFTYNVIPGGIQMSSGTAQAVKMVDMSGRVIWQGTVDASGVQVNAPRGQYIVNGAKVQI